MLERIAGNYLCFDTLDQVQVRVNRFDQKYVCFDLLNRIELNIDLSTKIC